MDSERMEPAAAQPDRKRYAAPELVRLSMRASGDNVLGGCKVNIGESTNVAPSATCDTCSTIGS